MNSIVSSWVGRHVAWVVTGGAILSAIATYIAMADSSQSFGPDPERVTVLMLFILIFLLALMAIVAVRVVLLWTALRRGSTGSRMQTRIVVWFCLIAIIPTIIVVSFSTLFFSRGIQAWFDERVSTAIEASVAAAEGYLTEHKANIRADALAMANDLSREASVLSRNPRRMKQVLKTQAALRNLTEAVIFQRSGILARTDLSFFLLSDFERLPPEALDRAAEGNVVIFTESDDRVRALVKLYDFLDTYLLVGRFVDRDVLEYIERARGSSTEYQKLKAQVSKLQIQFSIVFIAVALLLLLASIWSGMIFASALVRPISALVDATERVKAGDLDIRLEEHSEQDEIGLLGRAFNRMTTQLDKQRRALIEANRQLDDRRRFSEAVLAGVSAGILALDDKRQITLCNRSAIELLATPEETMIHARLTDILPEAAELMANAERDPRNMVQDQITLTRDSHTLTLLFRIVRETSTEGIMGYVVTFDDITALQSAQRQAAWADVARRIAHEIKNPLTPICLAAERLRSKYSKEVQSDPEMFQKYTDTIARHARDIGSMVEEFVHFARMPAPELKPVDLRDIVKEAVFSQEVSYAAIRIKTHLPETPVIVPCDRSLLSRALGNLLKNAAEALSEMDAPPTSLEINVFVTTEPNEALLTVEDNGPGFPENVLQ
ncbi:MAG: HAMP domain-containing protein, partial [Rickettsiales bacterium]|nr:HAMP domain-containing protein [Rickettsiales bacterium]